LKMYRPMENAVCGSRERQRRFPAGLKTEPNCRASWGFQSATFNLGSQGRPKRPMQDGLLALQGLTSSIAEPCPRQPSHLTLNPRTMYRGEMHAVLFTGPGLPIHRLRVNVVVPLFLLSFLPRFLELLLLHDLRFLIISISLSFTARGVI
jgi:hypothetical protein